MPKSLFQGRKCIPVASFQGAQDWKPRLQYHHYPFWIYTGEALGCLKEQPDPWTHGGGGDCLGSWTECPVISAVWLHHKSSFSIGPLGKRPWVLRRQENSKDTLILEPQPQGLVTDCRCLGGTVSAQRRGKWLSLRVWGLRCAENFPSLTRWLSVFLSAFHPQLSKEGRGVQGPSWDLVYTTVALSSCWRCGCSWDWDCPPPGFSGSEDSAPLSLLHAALFRRTKSETTQSFQFSSA